MEAISQFLSGLLSAGPQGLSFGQAIGAIAIAYLGGILSSLTPCVYPMIPITVGVVGGMPESGAHSRRSWRSLLIRAGAYISGMAIIYSALGVGAGLTGKIFGTLTNTSGWYLGLGIIITIAALIMMDIIHFDPAAWWATFKNRMGWHRSQPAAGAAEMSLLGAFALGASSGFIAAPCTTPVLTSILAYIAQTQSVFLGLALMISFSFGLGTLLLAIALFTGALQLLPRSGKWMNVVKVASGLTLLAFGEYLIYRAGNLGGVTP